MARQETSEARVQREYEESIALAAPDVGDEVAPVVWGPYLALDHGLPTLSAADIALLGDYDGRRRQLEADRAGASRRPAVLFSLRPDAAAGAAAAAHAAEERRWATRVQRRLQALEEQEAELDRERTSWPEDDEEKHRAYLIREARRHGRPARSRLTALSAQEGQPVALRPAAPQDPQPDRARGGRPLRWRGVRRLV